MKNSETALVCMMMLILSTSTAIAQRVMKLDPELKSASKPIEAKRKGVHTISRYEFGPYRIISGKSGFTTTSSSKRFLSPETVSRSKSKSSFVFVAGENDTVVVNTITNAEISETSFFNMTTMNVMGENYMAVFSSSRDTTVWRMVLNSVSGESVSGNFQAQGVLSDGMTIFRIRAVKEWDNGKVPIMNVICGYEFIIDGKCVAAVQASMDSIQKKFVWLREDLEPGLKVLFAAVSAALMVHADALLAGMN